MKTTDNKKTKPSKKVACRRTEVNDFISRNSALSHTIEKKLIFNQSKKNNCLAGQVTTVKNGGFLSFTKMIMFIMAIIIVSFSEVKAQTEQQKLFLQEFSERKSIEWQRNRQEAERLADSLGLVIRGELDDGTIFELQRFENGMPVYYITNNLNAAKTVSTDKVWPGGGAGLNLSGLGETLGIWDGGRVRHTHQELTGRVQYFDTVALSDHATHVAGTMIAAGVDPLAKGMAYEANLRAFDWNNDISEMATEAANGLLVSNHSYGRITGWRKYNGVWYWYGDIAISQTEDYKFGFYDSETSSYDSIAFYASNYLIVKSAGNDRNDVHNGGHFVWNNGNWVWSTVQRDPDGGINGYDCIPTYGVAKNILTIGAVNDIPNGYSQPSDVVMTSFSGWGPADDGRIKPDLVANGRSLYSCISTSNSNYDSKSGTSMATPNVSGSIALLNQHYKNTHANAILRSATMKALLIHSADEAGPNDGPDYQFGWGLLNTKKSAQIITDDSIDGQGVHIRELTLNENQTIELRIWPKGTDPLKVTLAWTDPAGTPPANSLNPATRMLINDLNLKVIDNSTGTVYYPYRLDPANPNNPATNASNFRDNVEQVVFTPTGQCTRYTVKIKHLGALTNGDQDYSLIITGNQANIIYVKKDALGNDDGTSWTDAYTDLHDAITSAVSGNDIWVAGGTYVPTGNGSGRSRHFEMKNCVEIFGGFEGTENPNSFDLMNRNLLANETILDGGCNRYHVFKNTGIDSTAVLDGCTITHGKAANLPINPPSHADEGGGMHNIGSDPKIKNCRFIQNEASGLGAGMYNSGSSPKITNCIFSGNFPPDCGGGMFNTGGSPKIINSIFSGNTATQGGGFYNVGDTLTIINSTISGNLALYEGGGLHNAYQSYAVVYIFNSIIWGNKVKYESPPNGYLGHEIFNGDYCTTDLENTCYQTGGNFNVINYGTINYGTSCITNNPIFVAPVSALSAPTIAGNYRLQLTSPAIDAGNNWYVPSGVNYDIDWNPRIEYITVDMGAYELPYGCTSPKNLAAKNITDISANLIWTPGGSETKWNIEWGPQGFVPSTGTFINGVVTNSYLLTGLTPYTDYDFYVRADCGGGSSSTLAGPCTFKTLNFQLYPLPFYEDFAVCTFPVNWTDTSNVMPGLWLISNSNSAGGSPYEMQASWTNGIGITRLISPPVNIAGVIDLKLEFLTYYQDYGQGINLKIQSSSDGINWTDEGWSYSSGSGNIPSGTLIDVSILNNLGATTYIAWVLDGDHYQFDFWYIDNINLFDNNQLSVTVSATPGTICTGDVVQLNATVAGGSGNYSYNWTSTPAGFTSSQQNPTDTPAVNTTYNVTVDDGFNTVTASVDVSVIPNPTANAGPDATVSSTAPYTFTAANATNYSSLMWGTSGDGLFNDVTLLNPIYLPGPNDILTGTVILTLTANPINPCTVSVFDDMILTISGSCQTLNIPQGWSGISTYVQPQPPDVVNMFAPILPDLVILMSKTGYYWPATNTNTIGNWNAYEGYVIKILNDVTLQVCGSSVTSTSVNLNTGWNLIPVLSSVNVSAATVFGPLPCFVVAKGIPAGVYWPAYGIYTLGSLEPGKAYWVYVTCPCTLTYPPSPMKSSETTQAIYLVNNSPWNDVNATSNSHIIVIPDKLNDVFEKGDIIGVFNQEGVCTGMAEYTGASTALAVYADDFTTPEIDGMTENEKMYFKVFKPYDNSETDLNVTFNSALPNSSGLFEINGMSEITNVEISASSVSENFNGSIRIYPNPTTGIINIEGVNQESEIQIFNAVGAQVFYDKLNGTEKIDLSGNPIGVYILKISNSDGVYFEKVILN